ncbi:MAG: hypothetical protein AB1564_13570 [Chloroflexota bacterium]
MIPLFLFLIFYISFRGDFANARQWLAGVEPLPDEVPHSLLVLGVNFLAYVILYVFWLLTVSAQAVLPSTRLSQVFLTAIYMLFHTLGLHGMAVYVRNGRIKAYVEELQLTRPGTAIVDFNSALLTERIPVRGLLTRLFTTLLRGLLRIVGANLPPVRIHNAKVVFTLPDERIRGVNDLLTHPITPEDRTWMDRIVGVVDLRNQFRLSGRQPHKLSKRFTMNVFAYTRDGIEVESNVWVMANLGQEPIPYFPLNVTYVGDREPRNLRVVTLKKVGGQTDLFRVQSISSDSDELEPQDRLEIHAHFNTITAWTIYANPPSPPLLPIFNAGRVFSAVYARARHHLGLGGADEIIPWVELPVHVAVDLFREIISRHNYNELCDPETVGTARGKLNARMRNSGMLSCRPLLHVSGAPLEEGRRYPAQDLLTVPASQALLLRSPKVLRDRGIRIMASGFGDLKVDERIYKQRLNLWSAGWDRETEETAAGLDVESIRARTRARIHAQREFVERLAQPFQTAQTTREILALRVLQALETAAADPKTRQLLPEDTITLLNNIHDWLLPEDSGSSTRA